MEKYWEEFEDTEENKFVYTDIHKEYVSSTIEYFVHLKYNSLLDHQKNPQKIIKFVKINKQM